MAYIVFWSEPVTSARLKKKLENYRAEKDDEDTGITLIENLENFLIERGFIHFDFVYDRIIQTSYRGEGSHYVRDDRVSIIAYKNEETDIIVYITSGNKHIISNVMWIVSDIIFNDESAIKRLPITRNALKRIVTEDNAEISRAWIKDIDEYTDTAALSGSLKESPDFQRFWRQGSSTYAVYISIYLNKSVGVSVRHSSIVYLEERDVVKYLNAILIPELEFQ